MKYNKEWKKYVDLDEIDLWLAISYDKWKQRIKKGELHFKLNWRIKLEHECERIDNRLFNMGFVDKYIVMHQPVDNKEKIKVCELNKKTLYKICKKLDKKLLKSHDAMQWYVNISRNKRYKFLGCSELCRIRLAMGEKAECPICFETVCLENSAITRCCHVFCTECAEKLWNLSKFFGYKTQERKIMAAGRYGEKCPLCRCFI